MSLINDPNWSESTGKKILTFHNETEANATWDTLDFFLGGRGSAKVFWDPYVLLGLLVSNVNRNPIDWQKSFQTFFF